MDDHSSPNLLICSPELLRQWADYPRSTDIFVWRQPVFETAGLYSPADVILTQRLFSLYRHRRCRPARIDNEREPLQQHARRDEEFAC